MRLISLELEGQYKGLQNQIFSFEYTNGNIIVFIGLNGSGKSQLLELISESFAYLERFQRADFKVRNWLNIKIILHYENQIIDHEIKNSFYKVEIQKHGDIQCEQIKDNNSFSIPIENLPLPSHILGYSSGLNENLHRAFMKNSIQYIDVMNIKKAWESRLTSIRKNWDTKGRNLTEVDLEILDMQIKDAYTYYQKRNPGIFPNQMHIKITENPELGLRATPVPIMKYLDNDTTELLLVSLGMLHKNAQESIFRKEQAFNKIGTAIIQYDLREFTYDVGAILDIAKLIQCTGGESGDYFSSLSRRTSDEFYNQFELDYLAGQIKLDFGNDEIKKQIKDAFFEPAILFEKLYRIHLLGANHWPTDSKKSLRQDNFLGNIKKPQKWKAPIKIVSLQLTNNNSQSISFEDLSDGEAQLIQILSLSSIFKQSRSLFLLDEPETHLNPSWRTLFHSYLDGIINNKKNNPWV